MSESGANYEGGWNDPRMYRPVDVSTERVRGAATGSQNVSVLPEQFDRWLAEHDRQVRAEVLKEAERQIRDEASNWHSTYRCGWEDAADVIRNLAEQRAEVAER